MSNLATRLADVERRIAAACAANQRNRDDVTLIVVTKFHPASLVLDLFQLGQCDFGENKDQEAGPKALEVASLLSSKGLVETASEPHWHFVGQLQSNKAKSVLKYASTIHSLDRDSLLVALSKERAKLAVEQPEKPATGVFVELNLTTDENRGGISPENLEPFAERVLRTDGLNLLGVMGVATLEGQEERDFETIAKASQTLQALSADAKYISAGMSNDFELALAYGATHLRIGTAITGPRPTLT